MFADDTILYVIADNPTDSIEALNNDLKCIKNWADEWLVKFSPPKTKSLTLSRERLPKAPPLIFDDTDIEEVTAHKHLGLTISHDLSWGAHIDKIVSNAGKCVDVLNALKYKLDRITLERLYFAFVRSKLEYASIVWDNCTVAQQEQLEQVQYRAGKIVSGGIHRTSKELIYKELGWHSLSERRQTQRLKVFHKMTKGTAPLYLQKEIPIADPNRENLRSESDIPRIRGMVFYQNTFIPKTIVEWNDLDEDVKSCDSSDTFTSRITRDIDRPSWFLAGKREPSMLHARMRMKCSPLNDDLHTHIHVLDSSECACGYKKENSKHFLLDCPLYENARKKMLSDLDKLGFKPTTKNLLYGNINYSETTNIEAFIIIQNYIMESKRFK